MRSLQHQNGIGATAFLIIVLVIGFTLLCAFRMAPAYLDNRYIQQSLKSLAEDPELKELSNRDIRSKLGDFFNINGIRSVRLSEVLDIDRRQGRVLVNMNYEVRVPIAYNVDVVMSFNNVLDTSKPDKCCSATEEISE